MAEQLELELDAPEVAVEAPHREAPFPLSAGPQLQAATNALHRELAEGTGLSLRLRITNNSSTMMSLRYTPDGKIAKLSLHHMFLTAGAEVRSALADWIRKPRARKAGSLLDNFIREHSHHIAPAPPRVTPLRASGQHHNLQQHFQELNQQYFQGAITAQITWGRMPRLHRRHSIRFGSYAPKDNIIRMHPLLDQDFVPAFFVRYIVFHEMLHAHLGIEELPSGRRAIHTREFKRQERVYPDYERALAWMRHPGNLDRLLRARRAR